MTLALGAARPARTWVELCCGSAAVTLRLIGGPGTRPPAGYMGGKRRWAASILDLMGVRGQRPNRVVLCDAGPWGRFWQVVLAEGLGLAVAGALLELRGRDERGADLHHALVAEGQPDDLVRWAAAFIVLQASAANGKPVLALPDGRWRSPGYAHLSVSARARGFTTRLNLGELADRVERIARLDWPPVTVHQGDAGELEVVPGADVYIDPPYLGTTGYGVELERARVEAIAARWAAQGCRVAVSERQPLSWAGWHHAAPEAAAGAPRTFGRGAEGHVERAGEGGGAVGDGVVKA